MGHEEWQLLVRAIYPFASGAQDERDEVGEKGIRSFLSIHAKGI